MACNCRRTKAVGASSVKDNQKKELHRLKELARKRMEAKKLRDAPK